MHLLDNSNFTHARRVTEITLLQHAYHVQVAAVQWLILVTWSAWVILEYLVKCVGVGCSYRFRYRYVLLNTFTTGTTSSSKLLLQYSSIELTLYQPMTRMCVMSSRKPIRLYMEGLILGVNTWYRLFCFFKLFPIVGKGLKLKPPLKLHQDSRNG